MIEPCRSCGAERLERVFTSLDVPVENSLLYANAPDAEAVLRGDLTLDRCSVCGFVQNGAFDESRVRYDADYEDSQSNSAYFREFADRVITELLDRYDLRDVRVLEIGCGQGDFLRAYCNLSGGTGVGVDPAAPTEMRSDKAGTDAAGSDAAIEFRTESFGVGSGHHDAGVVVCRHTLEHVGDVFGFLSAIRREFVGRPDTVLYLEVPDSARIASDGAFWDLYYEHCSYFDRESLLDLLRRTGWDPLECRLDYAGQYLVAHARPGERTTRVERGAPLADFSRIATEVERWRQWAAEHARRDTRLALWAASSKSVGFLANVPMCRPVVAVDINPAKWGRFIPGSGLPVIAPDEIDDHDIDSVLVMNPVYLDEIRAQLDSLGLHPDLIPLDV